MYCVYAYAFYNDVYTVACWSYNYNYYNSLLLRILLAWASKRGNESEWVMWHASGSTEAQSTQYIGVTDKVLLCQIWKQMKLMCPFACTCVVLPCHIIAAYWYDAGWVRPLLSEQHSMLHARTCSFVWLPSQSLSVGLQLQLKITPVYGEQLFHLYTECHLSWHRYMYMTCTTEHVASN